MGPHGIWSEGGRDFLFATLFVVTAPSLSNYLYRHTRCKAASLLVQIGMVFAAAGLVVLGIGTFEYLAFNPDNGSPFAAAALVCQVGGASIMTGGLFFTHEFERKLRESGARDVTLKATPLGFRTRDTLSGSC